MSNPSGLSKEFYENLKNELSASQQALRSNYSFGEEETYIRPVEEARKILEVLEQIQQNLSQGFATTPSLERLFDKEFISFQEFTSSEVIIEICFLDDYFFPESEKFPLMLDDNLAMDMIQSYTEFFSDWIKEKERLHQETQDFFKVQFDITQPSKKLPCQCTKCQADYRNRLRDEIFQLCLATIEETEKNIGEGIGTEGIDTLSERMSSLLREIDKKIHSIRFRLKRASLNKLENQLRSILKAKFLIHTELGSRYQNVLNQLFDSFCEEEKFSKELIENSELDRFFRQLGLNIWKPTKFLKREFTRLTDSILRLKRKDISSTILQEYLGQFWLHAEARRINRKIIYHMGPTNSGKTYHAIEALCAAPNGCYLAPLRLLAGELFDTMTAKGVKTTLLTGEEVLEVEDSTHYSSTIEMVKLNHQFDCCVIDEIQMINDPQRGWAWTRALVGIYAKEVHICGDDSVRELVETIVKLTGDELEIRNYKRLTELQVMDHPIALGKLQRGDALIVFSRRNALKYKSDLEKLGLKVSIVYGRLGPEVRREQARKFDEGITDVIVSTDAIAMGMNLPIKRIIFSTLTKFIDNREFNISFSEIKQIAGRAGRYLRFPVGQVTCLARVKEGVEEIQEALSTDLNQKEQAMVGPDLEIFNQVNSALMGHNLSILQLSEFLRLFNTMNFVAPFYCVDLKEMIDLAEMVESANEKFQTLSSTEIFGFSCAPVNLGLVEHLQYFVHILNTYIRGNEIINEEINFESDNIDYLETTIKCVELYQWLGRHFNNKNFVFNESDLLKNKSQAIEKLNTLLSDRIVQNCSSCGAKLDPNTKYTICEECFKSRRTFRRRPPAGHSNARRPSTKNFRKKH